MSTGFFAEGFYGKISSEKRRSEVRKTVRAAIMEEKEMSSPFVYYTPTKVYFGRGEEEKCGERVREAGGTKVLVHYGSQSAVKSGLIGRILASLDRAGIAHVELGGVVPNPHLGLVREGIALAQKENVDFILAVGGGSAIDSSKAIAYALGEPEYDVWDLFTRKRAPKACFPVGCVLTIAAAGSETSNSCVITDETTREKRSVGSNLARPRFAIMNPELTMTLPDYQTMSGCVDIMMHTMERYFTNGGNMDLTDEIAEGLLRTVKKHALILHADPLNYESRAEVMWAGSLSHNDLTGCGIAAGDFMSHKLGHELSGMFDAAHGASLSAVWPSWARYVYKNCLHRFVKFAVNVMGVEPGTDDEETALAGIAAMEAFYHAVGMPADLKELLGFNPTEEQIDRMAASAYESAGGPKGSAMVIAEEDFRKIYRMALG